MNCILSVWKVQYKWKLIDLNHTEIKSVSSLMLKIFICYSWAIFFFWQFQEYYILLTNLLHIIQYFLERLFHALLWPNPNTTCICTELRALSDLKKSQTRLQADKYMWESIERIFSQDLDHFITVKTISKYLFFFLRRLISSLSKWNDGHNGKHNQDISLRMGILRGLPRSCDCGPGQTDVQ